MASPRALGLHLVGLLRRFLYKGYLFARWHGWTQWRLGDASQVALNFRQRRWGKIVFSQHGEDLVIHRLLFKVLGLDSKKTYNYVDVGAYHPFDHSVTAHLSLLGWRGIAVDFSKTTESAFSRYRPATLFVRGAAGTGNSMVEALPSGTSFGDAGIIHSTKLVQSGGFQTLRVSDIVDTNGMSSIEFLNVDVEGAELAVLQGIDFDRHAPLLICVEIHGIRDLAELIDNPVAEFIFSQGYVAVSATVINFFFVQKTSLIPGQAG